MPPLSAQPLVKTRPLSYAERAKKAQNIKSPVTPQVPRSANPPPTPILVTTATTSDSTDITSDFPPVHVAADPDPSPPLSPPGMDPLVPPGANTINGSSPPSKNLVSAALSIVAAHSSIQKPLPPPVNVWNVRKMAQAQHQQSQLKPSSVSQPTPNASLPKSAPQPVMKHVLSAHDNDAAPPLRRPPDARHNGNSQRLGQNARVPANGVGHPSSNDNEDPFVVRVYSRPQRPPPPAVPQPPSIHDTDSWPEVGKAPSNGPPPHQGTSVPDGIQEKHGEGEDVKETPLTVTQRKSASFYCSFSLPFHPLSLENRRHSAFCLRPLLLFLPLLLRLLH